MCEINENSKEIKGNQWNICQKSRGNYAKTNICFSMNKNEKLTSPNMPQAKKWKFSPAAPPRGSVWKETSFWRKTEFQICAPPTGSTIKCVFQNTIFHEGEIPPLFRIFHKWKTRGIVFTLLALEFAMLIFHKAVGVYFANCTITIKAQTRTHGQSIKTWNSQSIMQMQMDCQKPSSLRIIDKGHTFQTNPTCRKFNTCWLSKGLCKPHQQYFCQIATPKQTKHTHTHTHTHTPRLFIQSVLWRNQSGNLSMQQPASISD